MIRTRNRPTRSEREARESARAATAERPEPETVARLSSTCHRSTLAVLLVAPTLTAGCAFPATASDSYTSPYDYHVGVDATGTLSDVTIRLPLTQGGASADADAFAPNGDVDGFDASVVDTEYGPMIELTANEFAVETRYYRFVEEDGIGRREGIDESEYDRSNPDHHRQERRTVTVSVTREATYPVETRAPVGESPTFDPDATRELTDCPVPYRDETAWFAYDTPVFLSYDAAADARASGGVTVSGSNEWFTGGWTGNSYGDRMTFTATGPRDEWLVANGTTEVGHGTYPSPEPRAQAGGSSVPSPGRRVDSHGLADLLTRPVGVRSVHRE